jgi:hypothetical protein
MSDSLLRQREFFKILEEFFRKATGKQPKEFANIDKFGEVVRAGGSGSQIVHPMHSAYVACMRKRGGFFFTVEFLQVLSELPKCSSCQSASLSINMISAFAYSSRS